MVVVLGLVGATVVPVIASGDHAPEDYRSRTVLAFEEIPLTPGHDMDPIPLPPAGFQEEIAVVHTTKETDTEQYCVHIWTEETGWAATCVDVGPVLVEELPTIEPVPIANVSEGELGQSPPAHAPATAVDLEITYRWAENRLSPRASVTVGDDSTTAWEPVDIDNPGEVQWWMDHGEEMALTVTVIPWLDGEPQDPVDASAPMAGQAIEASVRDAGLSRGSSITGTVTDADARDQGAGTGIAGVVVTATRQQADCEEDEDGSEQVQTVTQPTGEYVLAVPCEGTYDVVVEEHPLYQSPSAKEVTANSTRDPLAAFGGGAEASADFALNRETGGGKVAVQDETLDSVEDAEVTLQGIDVDALWIGSTGIQGTTTAFELPWGAYELTVEGPAEENWLVGSSDRPFRSGVPILPSVDVATPPSHKAVLIQEPSP